MLYTDSQEMGFVTEYGLRTGKRCSFLFLLRIDKGGGYFSMDIQAKREKEKEVVSYMISLYCRKKHGGDTLCPECAQLDAYSAKRSDLCPFMETKTFCANCKVHCYKKDMRERIQEVMKFSGPRMLFHRPGMAIRHVIETRKEKRKLAHAK